MRFFSTPATPANQIKRATTILTVCAVARSNARKCRSQRNIYGTVYGSKQDSNVTRSVVTANRN